MIKTIYALLIFSVGLWVQGQVLPHRPARLVAFESRDLSTSCMYAIDTGDSGTHVSTLYDLDPLTGALSNPKNTGLGHTIGLELAPDGFLYTIRTEGTLAPGIPRGFYRIDPITGSSILVGPTGLSFFVQEGDLARDPLSGTMYGIANETLFTIDMISGSASVIGTVPLASGDISYLSFDAGGDLWAIDNTISPGSLPCNLLKIDPVTASILSSTSTSIQLGGMGGMELDEASGDLFVMDSKFVGSTYAGTNSVYKINTASGNLTLVGSLGINGGFAGLTACIPSLQPECMMTINGGDDFHVSDILGVNPATGTVGGPLSTGLGNTIGLEMAPDGSIYTIEITTKDFFQIDSNTGAATLVGNTGLPFLPFEGDLAFDPISGDLFGIADNILFTVDTLSGAATIINPVTPTNPNMDISYLCFDGAGVLYAIDNTMAAGTLPTTLHTLNPVTASILTSMTLPTPLGGAGGLDWDPVTDQLYVLDSKTPGSTYAGSYDLNILDPLSGTLSLIGPTGINQLYQGLTVCLPPPPCAEPPTEMVAWWAFDEPSTLGGGTVNACFDVSSSTVPDTGIRNGSATFGGSLNLNGGYVEVSDSSELNFGPNQDFSIDAWIKSDSSSTYQTILGKRQYAGGPGYLVLLYQGRLLLQLADGSGWSNYYDLSTSALNDGLWHFIGISVDRDNASGIVFYVDGYQIASFNPTGRSGDLGNSNVLRIGRQSVGSSHSFYGQIDEVEVFDRALPPSDFDHIYDASTSGKCLDCMVERSVAGEHNRLARKGLAFELLSTLRSFRDRKMHQTTTGRYYRDLYQAYNWRIAWLMLSDKALRNQTERLLFKYLPVFKDLLYGKAQYQVTKAMVRDGIQWLNRVKEADEGQLGGGLLSQAIDREMKSINWRDITNWDVQDLLKYRDR